MIGQEAAQRIRLLRRIVAGLSAMMLLMFSSASTADWIFIKIDGVQGESTARGHEGEIIALNYSWGMSQSGSMHMGGGGGAGKVSVQDLAFTHYIDKASPVLMKYCASGKHIEEVTVVVERAVTDSPPVPYLIIKLSRVLVSSVSTGASAGGERPTENVTLNFAQFSVEYVPQKSDGTKEGSIRMGWNIAENIAT